MNPPFASLSPIAAAGIALAIANAWLWRLYVAGAKADGIGPLARGELASTTPIVHGVGHAAPALLYLACLAGGPASPWLAAAAGTAAFAGGALWKFVVILRASHFQGFALPMQPQRGSGTRAAPERLGMV